MVIYMHSLNVVVFSGETLVVRVIPRTREIRNSLGMNELFNDMPAQKYRLLGVKKMD